MKTIKVNDVEYNIPESWNEVTVGQQIDISQVVNRDVKFRDYYNTHIYTGIPINLLQEMNINDFNSIINLMSFLKKAPANNVITGFTHNGHEYNMTESILRGQTQDFFSIEAVLKQHKDNVANALPFIIAIVCKRKGETLFDYDVEKRAQEFYSLPYDIVNNVWFFFAQSEKILSLDMKQYLNLQDQVMELSLSYSENSMKKLVGLGLFKRFLRTILLLYIRYTRKAWKSFYSTSQSEHSEETLKSVSTKNK